MIDPRLLEIQAKVQRGESVLKAIREALGYTRRELADKLQTTETTIYRWESGRSPATFTVPQMKALARELRAIRLNIEDLPDDIGPSIS